MSKASRSSTADSAVVIYLADTGRKAGTRVDQTCVSTSRREVRISLPNYENCEILVFVPKCNTRIHSVPERDSRVSTTQREVRIQRQTMPKRDIFVSSQTHEVHVQSSMSPKRDELKSHHPNGFEVNSSCPPATDLRDYMTRK